jgi:ABC-type Fe3+-hydroxamate transport system substrate-binding protein
VTDYCVFPVEGVKDLPHIGGTKNPDIARIIALRPDLVIANQEENRKEDVEALRAAHIPVWVTFPRTVSDTFNLLWNIMDVFDEPAMVPRVRLIEQSMDWVWRISELRVEQESCRVFVPIWNEPLMTFNGDTYANDILRVCGAVNVFASRERLYPLKADLGMSEADVPVEGRDVRYPRVTIEEVIAAQPDVILLPSEPFQFTNEHISIFAGLDIPAAKNGRIELVDGTLLTWHGTRIAYALNTLPDVLYPNGKV